jgi:hypothetical protein
MYKEKGNSAMANDMKEIIIDGHTNDRTCQLEYDLFHKMQMLDKNFDVRPVISHRLGGIEVVPLSTGTRFVQLHNITKKRYIGISIVLRHLKVPQNDIKVIKEGTSPGRIEVSAFDYPFA